MENKENKMEQKEDGVSPTLKEDEFIVCGHLVKFRCLTVKDEQDIYERLRGLGLTLGSIGLARITNLYILAKGIESINDKPFNDDFTAAVSWLSELDNYVFDYFVQAWTKFMDNKMRALEEKYATYEVPLWHKVGVNPSTVGK